MYILFICYHSYLEISFFFSLEYADLRLHLTYIRFLVYYFYFFSYLSCGIILVTLFCIVAISFNVCSSYILVNLLFTGLLSHFVLLGILLSIDIQLIHVGWWFDVLNM